MDLLHPGGDDLVGVLVGGHLGLAVDDTLEVDTSQGLVHGLETDAEGALAHAGSRVLGRAEQVALREVDGDALGNRVLGDSAETAILGSEKIDNDLHVGSVIAGVGEDHDGLDVALGEVAGAGGGTLLLGEDAVRGDRRVPGNNVVGHDNVLEAVLLSDLAALVTLTTDNEDGVVVLGQGAHGGVGLNELIGADGVLEDLGELLGTGKLGLTRAVGKEDVGDLDAKLVVAVEHVQDLLALRDQTITVDEDTIDIEDEGHVLDLLDLLRVDILDAVGQELAGRLERKGAVGILKSLSDAGEGDAAKTRLALGAGDRKGSAEGVAGKSPLLQGWRSRKVVHVEVGMGIGRSGGWYLDGVVVAWRRRKRNGKGVVAGRVTTSLLDV